MAGDPSKAYGMEDMPGYPGPSMPERDKPITKAWRITIKGWSGFEMIWPGETRGKAKASAWIDCYTSGWDYPFIDFRAVRVPTYDEAAQESVGKYPWCIGWRDGNEVWGVLSQEE